MAERWLARHRWMLVCASVSACTLTDSLDDLRGEPDAGGGAGGSSGSASGAGGGFPDAAAGTGGSSGAGTGGTLAGAAGSGGSAGSGGTSTKDPPWWDASWPKRLQLTIANGASQDLPSSFEIGFPIDPVAAFGEALTSFAVVQHDSAGVSARPHFVETAAGTTWIWTPLPSDLAIGSGDTTLWLYAGAASASPGDPANVFTHWDGFDNGLTNWYSQGNPTLSNGLLMLANYSGVRSKLLVSSDHAVDFAMRVDQHVATSGDWISTGFQRAQDFDDFEPWMLWISRNAGQIQQEVNVSVIPVTEVGSQVTLPLGETRIYGVERFGGQAVFKRDNLEINSIAWNGSYGTSLQIRLNAKATTAATAFDWVRVRRASDPPPSVSLGTYESGP